MAGMRGYYVTHDLDGDKLGFAPAKGGKKVKLTQNTSTKTTADDLTIGGTTTPLEEWKIIVIGVSVAVVVLIVIIVVIVEVVKGNEAAAAAEAKAAQDKLENSDDSNVVTDDTVDLNDQINQVLCQMYGSSCKGETRIVQLV